MEPLVTAVRHWCRGTHLAPKSRAHWLRAVAFGATMLASSAINNVFVTYSLDFFRNVSHVSPIFFYCGQLVYLVFNSLNDPIFGWLSDNTRGSEEDDAGPGTGGGATTGRGRPRGRFRQLRRRQNAIRVGGAIWALAFALTWWPWGASSEASEAGGEGGATGASAASAAGWSSSLLAGLHFVLCLCAYDGALTYVEVNHAAVLAEMTTSSAERADSNMMSAVAAAVGSGTSVVAHLCYDRADMTAFRVLALVIALGSIVAFELSAVGIGWETSALQEALGVSHRVVRVSSSQVTLVGAAGSGFGGTPGSSSSSSSSGGGGYSPMAAPGYSPMAPQSSSPMAGQGGSSRPMALQRGDGSNRSLPALADTGGSAVESNAGVELRHLEPARHRQVAGARSVAGGGGTPAASKRRLTPVPSAGRGRKGSAAAGGSAAPVSYRTFLGQLLSSRNIVVFIAFSALQTFDCTFEKSFFAPFSDIVVAAADVRSAGLLGSSGMDAGTLHRRGGETQRAASSAESWRSLGADGTGTPPHAPGAVGHAAAASVSSGVELGEGIVSRHSRSVIISLSFLLPHALTVVWTPLVSSWGMHGTLTTILLLRLGLLGSAALFHGLEPAQTAASAAVALGFMLSNRVLSESVCRLFPLVLSDLIDEDAVTHRRAHALSASLVGASAVFSKASQSLAPMIAFYVLPPDLGALLSSPGHRGGTASDGGAAHVSTQAASGPTARGLLDEDADAPRWRAYPHEASSVAGRMLAAAGTDGEAAGSFLFGRPGGRETQPQPSSRDTSEQSGDEGQALEVPAAESEHASGAGSLLDAAAAAVVHAVEAAESGEEAALDTLMPLQSVQDLSAAVEAGIAQVEGAAAAGEAVVPALIPRGDAILAPIADSAAVTPGPGRTGSAASSPQGTIPAVIGLPVASSAAAVVEPLHVGQPPPATDADEVAAAAEVHVVLPPPTEPRPGKGEYREGSKGSARGSARAAASQAAVLYAAASRVWGLLLAMPSVCVLLQLVLWRYGYTLYGKRLTNVKALADELAAAGLPGDGDRSGDDLEQSTSSRAGISGGTASDERGSDRLHRSA